MAFWRLSRLIAVEILTGLFFSEKTKLSVFRATTSSNARKVTRRKMASSAFRIIIYGRGLLRDSQRPFGSYNLLRLNNGEPAKHRCSDVRTIVRSSFSIRVSAKSRRRSRRMQNLARQSRVFNNSSVFFSEQAPLLDERVREIARSRARAHSETHSFNTHQQMPAAIFGGSGGCSA